MKENLPNLMINDMSDWNVKNAKKMNTSNCKICTGKSFSVALILASTNPQEYDKRLFMELQDQYMHENSKLRICQEHVGYMKVF